MGCFDVVCALTNTPIHNGDKCHLVVLRRDANWQSLVWLQTSEGRIGIDRVFHGAYNDYGSIEECTPALTEKDEEYLEEMHDHENPRKSFFVCDTAWNWCQEKFADWKPWFVQRRDHAGREFPEDVSRPRELAAQTVRRRSGTSAGRNRPPDARIRDTPVNIRWRGWDSIASTSAKSLTTCTRWQN